MDNFVEEAMVWRIVRKTPAEVLLVLALAFTGCSKDSRVDMDGKPYLADEGPEPYGIPASEDSRVSQSVCLTVCPTSSQSETVGLQVSPGTQSEDRFLIGGNQATQEQQVLDPAVTDCYGVGDCLIGPKFLYSSNVPRNSANEGPDPYENPASRDSQVQSVCGAGCVTGSRVATVGSQLSRGAKGDEGLPIKNNPGR